MPLPYDWSKGSMEPGPQGEWISMPAGEVIPEQWTSMWLMGWSSRKSVHKLPSLPRVMMRIMDLQPPSSPTHFLHLPLPPPTYTRLLYWRLPNASGQWKLMLATNRLAVGSGTNHWRYKGLMEILLGGMTHPLYLLQLKDSSGEWWCVFVLEIFF